MIAQQDRELFEWLQNASLLGGGFVSLLAQAALHADSENYPILRPALMVMHDKYRKYQPGAAAGGQS